MSGEITPRPSTHARKVSQNVTVQMFFVIPRISNIFGKEKMPCSVSNFTCLRTDLHRKDTIPKNSKQIFPGKELNGYNPNSYIHVSVSDLYIPLSGLPILLQESGPNMVLYTRRSLTDT
jgi:hypothetical protein